MLGVQAPLGSATPVCSCPTPFLSDSQPLQLCSGPEVQAQLMTFAGTSKGDISTFILAQDLFAMCGEQMRGTYVAAVHAARTFAGEEAHPVALTKFLGQAVPSLDTLTVSHG